MRSYTHDHYCPKCKIYVMGKDVTITNRHKDCGEIVELHPWQEDLQPLWFVVGIFLVLSAIIIIMAFYGAIEPKPPASGIGLHLINYFEYSEY